MEQKGNNMSRKKRRQVVHREIRKSLGYSLDQPDEEVLEDWSNRLGRVCKPCWELKYCPYGPFVEQSPLLPQERKGAVEHNKYLLECLETGKMGGFREIDEFEKSTLKKILSDDDMLRMRALHEIHRRDVAQRCLQFDNPIEKFYETMSGVLPPIEQYRVEFDEREREPVNLESLEPEFRRKVKEEIEKDKLKLNDAIKSGVLDDRTELDELRRSIFRKQTEGFDPESFPDVVPPVFQQASCNVFGHVCPVFFAAEALTETQEERRRGRYIPFKIKMRVVRRDNYTCQHCSEHLKDDQVEFDHIIPVAKGGSSEEQNIRLTCFRCNRDKSDKVEL